MISSFDQFKLFQTISFCSIEIDSEGQPIARRGIIRRIFKGKRVHKILLYRQSGPSKYDYAEDDIREYDLTFAELEDKEEIWDWAVMNNIWEIIVPPPIEIRNGGINWSCEKKEILETPFTGPPPGFKPGMDLGLGADDFAWIKQIITERHVEKYWLENSNKEGERLKLAAEERYRQTKRENMELFGLAHGKDSKWRRYRSLTLEIFYTFWSAKLAVKLFGWNVNALFTKRSFSNQTRKGQALFGWTREQYTMYNHVLRCHSPEEKKANFEKAKAEQNPFFGIENAFQDLIRILNDIRFPSRHLSFDEELIYMRGRSPVIQFVKDKRNRYGAKLFMLCGSNEGTTQRGYLHYGKFYRGKERERPTSFSGYGKGYETVMNSIVAMKLRYMGYWIMTDSWFSGLNLFLHAKIWGVNMAGTIVSNRKGLDNTETKKLKKSTLFSDLKKKLTVKYNPEKKKGYLRGH